MSDTHSGTGAHAAAGTGAHVAAGTEASPASGTRARAAHADTGPGLGTLLTQWMPATGTAVAFVLYTVLSILMWRANYAPSWDLGIFTQLLDQYARGQTPIVDIKGPGFHLWGDHFHPILILLTPLYWLAPSGLTLMIAQAALFASSVWPIASLARERLGTRGGWLVTGAYVFSWGLVNAVIAQFHEIAFAVPLLAFGLVWWMRGARLPALISIALLVFVKEDLGITVAVFGLIIWLRNRAETRAAIFLVAWGVAWTVFAVAIFIPAFNVTGGYDYSGQLTLAETLTAGLTMKLGTAGFLVLAAGGIGVRSPFILLMLPTLAWRFLGSVEGYWETDFHYSAVLMPIAAVCLIDAAARRHRVFAPFIAAIAAAAMLSQTQVELLWRWQAFDLNADQAIAEACQYDSVAADVRLLAHLVPCTQTFWIGSVGDVVPEAVLRRPDDVGQPVETWAEERFGGDWTVVYSGEGFELVERDARGAAG